MITKNIYLLFFLVFIGSLFSEEAPKKIILLEENLELEKADVEQIEKTESENEANKKKLYFRK